jgi:hypothetical protein
MASQRTGLVALAALTALATLSSPSLAVRIATPRPRPRLPPATASAKTTSVVSLQVADLPRESAPAPLDDSKKPASLPATSPDLPDIRVTPRNPAEVARFKTSKTEMWMQSTIEAVGKGASRIWLARYPQQSTPAGLTVNCTNNSANAYYSAPQAIRWERLSIDEKNEAVYEVNDGWFDPRGCRVLLEKKTVMHPKIAFSAGDRPLVFATRSDDELFLYFPTGTSLAVDQGMGKLDGVPAPTAQGTLARISLPIKKGLAASALADIPVSAYASWIASARGLGAPAANSPYDGRVLSVGVDAIQTVSDPAPTILLRGSY